jgi:mono/diheme cytochrome c family protein
MRIKAVILAGFVGLGWAIFATAQPSTRTTSAPVGIYSREEADAMRTEGEQRFRANCGRCHAAPQKFPPRMMATIVRHMRVRATITDKDMRLILRYMTQ